MPTKNPFLIPGAFTINQLQKLNKEPVNRFPIIIVLLAFFFGIAAPTSAAEDVNRLTIKIMTLNLHNGMDMNGQINFDRFVQLIAMEQPDIITLQEVQRSHLKYLKIPGYQSIAGLNVNCAFFRFGNALLTRHQIVYHRHHYLPGAKEQRGMDEVAIAINGQYLRVLNTHIGLGRNEQKRQIVEISRISRYLSGPLIITGDFNLEPFHELLTDFNFKEVSSGIAFYKTYPASQPKFHIDQIWYNDYLQSVDARSIAWQGSDHLPVVAELELIKTASLPVEQVAIPDPALRYNPLLPDVAIHPVISEFASDFHDSAVTFTGSVEVPLNNRFSLKAGSNGNEPELGINYLKIIDLRDYFSYKGIRGKAEWTFSAVTNLRGESWLEWTQYYRWGNQSGAKIVLASGAQKPDWSWEQYYLPLETFRLLVGVNGDSEFTIGAAVAPAKRQSIQLQYLYSRTGKIYRLSWNYRIH